MRTFVEKGKATEHEKSSRSALPHPRHEVNPVNSAELDAGDARIANTSRFSHDFSRIPARGPMPGPARMRQADSIAGKLDAPLPDGEAWLAIAGRAGTLTGSESGLAADGGAPAFSPAPAPGVFPPNPPAPASPPVAAAPAPPTLSKKTVSGPTANDCGGFNWVVQWELDKKTSKGGWIVQKVELPYDVKDCSGKAVDPAKVGGLQPSWYPLWEAWPVHKDQKVTTYAEGGDVADDTYGANSLSDTRGTVTVKGTAEFYDGLTLPSSFKVTNKAPAWILPSTTTAPTLAGGTGAISHNLKAVWDCCSKDKAATKATKVETT